MTLGGKVSEKTSFRVGMDLKKVEKQGGMRKLQEPYPTIERCWPPSGLQHNALASLVHLLLTQQSELGMQSALCWRPERGPAWFYSGVGFLKLSHSRPCFSTFFRSIPTRNEAFSETFAPSFCSFLGF